MGMEECSVASPQSSAHLLFLKSWISRSQGVGHNFLSFLHDRRQMILVPETFRINLVDVLCAGRPRSEPAGISDNLEPADRGAVTRGGSHFACDRLASESISSNRCRRQLLQSR